MSGREEGVRRLRAAVVLEKLYKDKDKVSRKEIGSLEVDVRINGVFELFKKTVADIAAEER